MTTERIFENEALTRGWENITNDGKTWWFDLDHYPKIYALDKGEVPIFWDDETHTEEVIKSCTYDSVCCLILSSGKTKVLVVVHANLPYVVMHGRTSMEIPWAEYATDGFMAIKKHITPYKLDAVVINPTVQTLEKYGVLKAIIQKFIKDAKLIEGGTDVADPNGEGEGSTTE